MGNIRVLDMVTVTNESLDHPFKAGDVVKVVKIVGFGHIWVESFDGKIGCLKPSEFSVVA